jgi:putative peptidoglycan lipid II flippase
VRTVAGAREQGSASLAADTAGDSITVAAWTVLSRVTGVVKIVAIGAVLGPTFLGNTFQFTNALPNLVYYGLLAGSLFHSLLVPALVRHVDAGDRPASERVAGGFFGVTVLGLAVVTPLVIWLAPLMLRLTAPVGNGELGADQERVGRWLIVMFMPQVFCYAVIGTSSAIMNARHRFALAAAAPALENVGMIAVLGVAAVTYGTGATLDDLPRGELLLLGLGTTGAVVLHAGVQWWGARRAGVTLLPRSGWHDPEVRALLRRALSSLGQAVLLAMQVLIMLTLANQVAGGVIAFGIALNFYYLAIALGVTPTALAVLPRLARMYNAGQAMLYRDTLLRGYAFALFLTIPAAVGYITMARPLAELLSFGRMDSATGPAMIAVALAALAPAVIGQTAFTISSYACFARENTRSPLVAMLVQAATCFAVLGLVGRVGGTAALFMIGVAFSTAVAVGAGLLSWSTGRWGRRGTERLVPSLLRICAGTALMAGPAWLTARAIPTTGLAVVAAAAVGFATYLGVQAMWRAPELSSGIRGLAGLRGKLAGTR